MGPKMFWAGWTMWLVWIGLLVLVLVVVHVLMRFALPGAPQDRAGGETALQMRKALCAR